MAASCREALLGVLLTLVANGALLHSACALARRFWRDGRASTRLAAALTLWIALTLAIFYPLALAGAFVPAAALVAAITVAVAVHLLAGPCGGLGDEPRAAAGWLRVISRSRGVLLLAGAGLLVLHAAYRAALWPPLSFDSLTYHNYLAGLWVQSGRLATPTLPVAMEGYAWLPIHFEALVAWAMLPFHGDFLANFVNLPVLALGAVALYGLCRELDLDPLDSSLAVGLVCLSPAVFAYVCTQYNDILVMSLLVCAALFLVRFLKGGRWGDATLVFLASGLAVGTKHTAIPPAAVICLVAALAAPRRRAVATLLVCLAVNVAAGGYPYVRNWLHAGNPLYPATISLLGKDVFPGAPVTGFTVQQLGRGDWRHDADQLARSMSYAYGMEPTPLSWGPKLPVLASLAVAAFFLARRSARRAELRWLTLCWAAPALLFYLDSSDNTVLIRRFWPDTFARFLAPSVALMTASALAATSLLKTGRLRRAIRAGLCVLVLYDILALGILPDTPRVLVAVGIGLVLALGVGALWRRRPLRMPAAVGVALAAIVAAAGVCGLHLARERWRNWFLLTRTELHPIPRHWATGWGDCDDPSEPKTIALVSYEPRLGHHWFFYPLMGRRLQNRVVYAPPDRALTGAARPLGAARTPPPSREVWLDNLSKLGVTHLFVQFHPELRPDKAGHAPLEMAWIAAAPEQFQLVGSGALHRIYRVLPPRPASR